MSDFDEIEALFAKLLITAGNVLSEFELDEIRAFIDVGEYGLALETTVDIFVEEGKTVSDEVVSLIEQLAAVMLMEPVHLILLKTRKRG
jgi:hypothetical protein